MGLSCYGSLPDACLSVLVPKLKLINWALISPTRTVISSLLWWLPPIDRPSVSLVYSLEGKTEPISVGQGESSSGVSPKRTDRSLVRCDQKRHGCFPGPVLPSFVSPAGVTEMPCHAMPCHALPVTQHSFPRDFKFPTRGADHAGRRQRKLPRSQDPWLRLHERRQYSYY